MLGRAARSRPLLRCIATQSLPFCPPIPTRHFSTTGRIDDVKPSMANIAEIRRILPGTTLVKAKEALLATSNDMNSAISWLEKDSAISGAKKASKVQGRQAKEGGIGITIIVDGGPSSSTPSSQGSMTTGLPATAAAKAGIVELNCETDFVGRNEIFQALLADLSHTVALFPTLALTQVTTSAEANSASSQELIDIPIKALLDFPLLPRNPLQQQQGSTSLPRTIGAAILDVISRLGENISISRASALSNSTIPDALAPRRSESDTSTPWLIASAFTHGGIAPTSLGNSSTSLAFCSTGRVGSLLLSSFEQPKSVSRRDQESLAAMRAMAKSLARQAAGMPTERVRGTDNDETSLYSQSFIMKLKTADLPEQAESTSEDTVQQALSRWGKAWTGDDTNAEAVSVLQLRRWELGEESGIPLE